MSDKYMYERQDIYMQIEQICKTKGKYLKDKFIDFESFSKYFFNKFKEFKNSIMNCLNSIKNLINEIIRYAQYGMSVTDKLSLVWFKAFLNMILKAAKHGLLLATGFGKKIMGIPLKEGIFSTVANALKGPGKELAKPFKKAETKWTSTSISFLCINGIFLGIISSVIVLAISLWLNASNRVITKLSNKPSLIEKLRNQANDVFGADDDSIPEELMPPDPDVPSVTMSYVREGFEMLNESGVEIAMGMFLVLLLKASIAASYNEEISMKNTILRSALPSGKLSTFLGLLMMFGAASSVTLLT